MKFLKPARIFVALGAFAGVTTGSVVAAQAQQTIASANQFLVMMIPDGVSTMDGRDDNGDFTEEVTITSITSSGCRTDIYATAPSNQRRLHRTIDWSKISNVYYYRGVQIQGPIRTANGSIDGMVITVAGSNTGERIATAMNFLREKCDSARDTGF